MRHCILAFFLLFSLSTSIFADPAKVSRVIYVTLDGVRWQDVFSEQTYFPKLWKNAGKFNGIFYGMPNTNIKMETASIPVSLPSYQSQMAGVVQPCDGNECGRIKVETVIENIKRSLNLAKKNVATFSSWPEINDAAESVFGATYANTGNFPVGDPDTHLPDAVMVNLNIKQMVDHPSGFDRYDKYTFAQAMHYLEKYQPRFLWISLDDADEAAHEGDLQRYHQALSFYDDALDQLLNFLVAVHLDQETLVIITTDHGRGDGDNWKHHGTQYPESKQTWAWVMNSELMPDNDPDGTGTLHYSTLSVRPTMEKALGLIG